MKTAICYFSGTGNTRMVAERFASFFSERGDEVTLFSVEDITEETLKAIDGCDFFGLGYPVYAFNAPPVILDFAKKLPARKEGKPIFLFETSGEPLKLNNVSSIKLTKILKKRNYFVTNEYHYCMPYNIIFRHSDKMAFDMWETAKAVIMLDAERIISGEEDRLQRVRLGGLLAWVMRCEHWGGRLNGRFYRTTKDCVKCGRCVENCPTKNIRITEKGNLKFGGKCLMCMRCAMYCPKDAIKAGLFNSWKVNGKYTFEKPADDKPQRYNKMLEKAYKRYFEEAEKRIEKTKAETGREEARQGK